MASEVLPLQKKKGGGVAILKGGGGHKSFFFVFQTRELEVLTSLEGRGGGGAQKLSSFPVGRGGRTSFYPVSRGRERKQFWTTDFPIL